jgi:DNA gyrase/topoisomerase IV subunit B
MILYSPQIIEAGKLYKIYPPLYGIKNGKKVNYIINDIDFVKFVQKDFMKSNVIMNTNKRVLSNVELMKLFLINDEYVRELEDLAANFGVEPEMMEFALVNNFNKTAFGPLKKNLVKEFRFMKVEKNKIGGGLIYEGTINQSNFLPFNDRLIRASKKVMDIIIKNDTLSFILNGRNASLYNVMKAYESAIPAGISRYKGLGEMNADQLANILKPNSERTMIQYTLEDAKAEIQTIREYESDRSKLLELVGTVKRSELME